MERFSKCLSLFLVLFFVSFLTVSAQTYRWVKGGGSTADLSSDIYDEEIDHMCTDANGNVYVLGVVGSAPVTADTFHLSSLSGPNENIFIASYNCNGVMRWAKVIASAYNTFEYGIAVDNEGHVYVAGHFDHTTTYPVYIGYDTTISAYNYLAMGLIQFDTSGHFDWIRFIGPNTATALESIGGLYVPLVLDGEDNPHMICPIKSGIPITPSITTTNGIYDLKFDATGALTSALRLENDSTLTVQTAAIDKATDKLYITGTRANEYLGTPPMSYHPYVAAFDISRNNLWSDTLSNPVIDGAAAFGAIATDGVGHLYLTAGAAGAIAYRGDTSRNVLSSISYYIAAIYKMDIDGNLKWKRAYSATTSINAFSDLTLMPNNKLSAVGLMAGLIVGGTDTLVNYSGEGQNGYFTVLDTAGHTQAIQQIHGTGFNDAAYAVASDKIGSLYISGAIAANVWGGSLTPYTSVGGNTDFFVMKYGYDCSCTAPPTAAYTDTGTHQTIGVNYTGTTTGLDSVKWNFGDGYIINATSATHTYSTPGTYHVCATVYTECGSDQYCQDITVSFTNCRPGTCIVDYNAHYDDLGENSDMDTILAARPDILIDNTPHSFYGQINSHHGCLPSIYTPLGIQVYSQLVGGYENTSPPGPRDSSTLATNISRIDSIASIDHASGIFLNEVSQNPTTAGKSYLSSIYNECHAKGLKLILNVGNSSFDNWLIGHCDYIVTRDSCSGGTVFTTEEKTYSGHTIALTENISGPAYASAMALNARTNGFAYVYACSHFTALPDWLNLYNELINQPIATPVASSPTGVDVESNAPVGNQWYSTTTGLIAGATVQNYHPPTSGYYYDIVTLDGCRSDTSNLVAFGRVGVASNSNSTVILCYPNPSKDELNVTGLQDIKSYQLFSVTGVSLRKGILQPGVNTIPMNELASSIYMLEIVSDDGEKNVIRVVKE